MTMTNSKYNPYNSVPFIIEERRNPAQTIDIYSRLVEDRIIYMGESFEDDSCNRIIAQLLYLDSLNNNPIRIYINSPGGSVIDGLAIIDTINFIKSPVYTICVGLAASMGSFLLASGTKGKRYALPNSEIMIHQPLVGRNGYDQETNIQILAQHLAKTRNKLEEIYSLNTGKSQEQIHQDCERDKYMTAEEALEYGLIDNILTK